MENKNDEMILAVERSYLFENDSLIFKGLLTDEDEVRYLSNKFKDYVEVRRGDAETDASLKQMIPYVVVRRGSDIFMYKRLSKGGEERLHDQLSIGVGGHMNRINDVRDWGSNLMLNMYRELHEELDIEYNVDNPKDYDSDFKVVGLINDDYDVGLYHIGILIILDLPDVAKVTVRETDVLEGEWVTPFELRTEHLHNLETWSQIAVSNLLAEIQ